MDQSRKIIHIDMDAFFASVEQRDNPALRSKPVIVGGLPNSRGVVATCSYEARKFGIHSAMPSNIAFKRCPQAVFIRTDMKKYKAVSRQIMQIFHMFTDLVEPLALDEAYLDVTENKFNIKSATIIAKEIKKRIYKETKLTASAGVSYNKFLAKVASGYKKPDGLTVVPPEQALSFIEQIPIGEFFGVGKVTKEKFLNMGIENGKDLRKLSEETLLRVFKERGRLFYQHARGIDNRRVTPNRKRKSLGREITLKENLYLIEDMLPVLQQLAEIVSEKLIQENKMTKCIILKVKFHDFSQQTKRITIEQHTNDAMTIYRHAEQLLKAIQRNKKSVRLLGISTTELAPMRTTREASFETINMYEQLTLF
ncbi:DNA polymerase IV [Pueribacillus theae]|uniref:DNA polymerase IV n=1 Tax=Pueribacillus theae TaxID=2171751 RepID=A0A2U1JJ06_9BACI|nr:DNA polymerase IV [Pueribacillus theae]